MKILHYQVIGRLSFPACLIYTKSPVNTFAKLRDNRLPIHYVPARRWIDAQSLRPPHYPRSGPFTVVQALPNNVCTIHPSDIPTSSLTAVHFNRLKSYAVCRTVSAFTRSLGPSVELLGIADDEEVPEHGGLPYRIGHHWVQWYLILRVLWKPLYWIHFLVIRYFLNPFENLASSTNPTRYILNQPSEPCRPPTPSVYLYPAICSPLGFYHRSIEAFHGLKMPNCVRLFWFLQTEEDSFLKLSKR